MDIVNSFIIEDEVFYYYDLKKVIGTNKKLKNLPIVLKILLEANLRKAKTKSDFDNIIKIFENRRDEKIEFTPSRLILEEFNELPVFIDLASIRDEVKSMGGDANKINPQILIDLIIDNSFLKDGSESNNKDYTLDKEKYHFIKWALHNFTNLRIIPPGARICHHVNLEFLSTILHIERKENKYFLYPETIFGTNNQTTMSNSLGVLGFRIDSIEAQLAILGLPLFIDMPKVVGIKVDGKPNTAISSSDIVSSLIKKLQSSNLNGKLVEFYGEGLNYLTLEDRSTVSIAAPKYGAMCSYFAIDNRTIRYFNKTRGNEDYGKLIKTYLENQNMFFDNEYLDYDEVINFDLSLVTPDIKEKKSLNESINSLKGFPLLKKGEYLIDGDIVFSVINTVELTLYHLVHSLLVIKKALEYNLKIEERVNAIFIIDSVKKEHLQRLNLLDYIEKLGFTLVCCSDLKIEEKIKNKDFKKDILEKGLNICSISSSSINIDTKDSSLIKSNYICSSSLVVFYSLIGNVKFDFDNDVIKMIDNKALYLKDIWPTNEEVISNLGKIDSTLYKELYKEIYKGDEFWQNIKVDNSSTYNWDSDSTYIQATKFPKENIYKDKIEIKDASILALLGDNITTEQILPSSQIPLFSAVSKYLEEKGVKSFEYNSFESRCGNPEVMKRTLFSSPDLKNLMISKEGGYTLDYESGEIIPIYKKALKLKEEGNPSIILAGKEFGKGVSKYWAVKGLKLLGIEVIIANSFDNQNRKNLINFGILPLEFVDDDNINSLKLKGKEKITIETKSIKENFLIDALIQKENVQVTIELRCRLENQDEVESYKKGGVLNTLYFDMLENSL